VDIIAKLKQYVKQFFKTTTAVDTYSKKVWERCETIISRQKNGVSRQLKVA